MIRQAAFHTEGSFLKGALHTHTTRSDGWADPAVVLTQYESLGYHFVALTDHNIYNYTNFAKDSKLILVPGMERDHCLPGPGTHVFHTVVLGSDDKSKNKYAQDDKFQGGVVVADQAAYQPILDDYHAHGNMTMYCHPQWSSTPAREFDRLAGNFAMEIWNSGCAIENDMDTNAACWDELLLQGTRIFGAATDDAHHKDHCGKGYVLVKAKPGVDSILEALAKGAFYSSCGPEIYDFYVGDGKAVLECSPCVSAGFCHGLMPTRLTHSEAGDVTRAECRIPNGFHYIRGVVKDAMGNRAWTNPIFFD